MPPDHLKKIRDEYQDKLRQMSDEDVLAEIQRPTWKHAEARAEAMYRNIPSRFYEMGGMVRERFVFDVHTEVIFTEDDVDTLMRFSKQHYDRKCQSVSEPGGFLYGMKNQFWTPEGEEKPKTGTWKLSMDDLGIMCKVTEVLLNGDEEKREWYLRFTALAHEAGLMWKALNEKVR